VCGLSGISSASICNVGIASCAGREPDVNVELPRHRFTVFDNAAPHLHILRTRVQVDLSGGVDCRNSVGRNDPGRRSDSAPGQSAVVVSADQPNAVVHVTAVAASTQERKCGKVGQL